MDEVEVVVFLERLDKLAAIGSWLECHIGADRNNTLLLPSIVKPPS